MFSLKLTITCSTILLTVAANCDSSSSEIVKCSGDSSLFSGTMGGVVSFRCSTWFVLDIVTLVAGVGLSSTTRDTLSMVTPCGAVEGGGVSPELF